MKKISILAITIILFIVFFSSFSWLSKEKAGSREPNKINNSSNLEPEIAKKAELFEQHSLSIYNQAKLASSGLDQNLFKKALIGYYNLRKTQVLSAKKALLSIIDFSKKSTEKRLWIIDLNQGKLLYNTLVAHGQGSGIDLATNFSDRPNSHQSSLGFYITSETYVGKHGLSMRLEGLDKGFNSNARARAVVIHGASYVSQDFINRTGRLGRSHGCPALPVELTKNIINTIKDKTCLFISGPLDKYSSKYLNSELAIANFTENLNLSKTQINSAL